MKQYMRDKKSAELACVRQIKAEIMKFESNAKDLEAQDEDIIKILNSLVKQHKESIDIYSKNDRPEQLAQEKLELEVIESFLPAKVTGAELEQLVESAIVKVGAQTKKDMGLVMKAVRDQLQNANKSVDGQELSELAKSRLN